MAITARVPQLDTLVLSRDDQTIRTFQPLVEVAGCNAQVCTNADLAVEMLARWRFDAVFVDCDSIPEGMSVIKALRGSPSNRTSVVFALVRDTRPADAFRTGATFVLDKRSAAERARTALRAAYGLMLLGRRRYHRRPVAAPATFQAPCSETLDLRTVNVSEGGVAMEGKRLPDIGTRGIIRFDLPGRVEPVRATVEVVWRDNFRAGMRFCYIPATTLEAIRQWIGDSLRAGTPEYVEVGSC